MDNRERFLRTMHFEAVDHPPLLLADGWDLTVKRWREQGLPEGMDLYEYFGLEPVRLSIAGLKTRFNPPFEDRILEDHGEYVIKIDSHGVKVKNFRDESSMAQHLEYPIKGEADLGWIRQKLNPDDPGRITEGWPWEDLERQSRGTILGLDGGSYYALLNEGMGTETLSMAFFDNSDFIHAVNDALCSVCERMLQTALPQIKLDFIGYHEDMAFKNGPLVSPAMFREFLMPYYRRITAITAPAGVDVHYMDSDGDISLLIPLWLECGINLFSPLEVAAGMDPVELRRQYGRDILLIGGIDKRALAAGKEAIDREIKSKVEPLLGQGGYLPTCDHGVPPDVSLADYKYFVDRLKSLYGMKPEV